MEGALVQVVPPNHFVTMDFRRNRVRLYVDSEGKIARAPIIG
ncbi:Subtilisin inhibitor CLSI-I [Linum perenne]